MVEDFDELGQFFIHFSDRLQVDRPTSYSRCDRLVESLSDPKNDPTTFDMVARKCCDSVNHLERFRDDLQKICLFTGNFICDLVRKRQNALQLIAKARQHLDVFVFLLQELNGQELPLVLIPLKQAQTLSVALATRKRAFAIEFS